MSIINKIFWEENKIGMITNHLETDIHRHWMLQLFIGIEDDIEITVNGKFVKCNCIVIDKNTPHTFSTRKKVYYSALIEPTSVYAQQLSANMNDYGYWVYDRGDIDTLRKQGDILIHESSVEHYKRFMEMVDRYLNIHAKPKHYDERITEFIHLLATCDCYNHTVSNFADKVALSTSRLSHLFKEQVGMPLKSYILLHQMECAFKELLDGKNITKAAMATGFNTPSHFAGTVKRLLGMSVSLSLKHSEFLKVY